MKPGELIDIRQSAALTLHDRRVLNLLIEHAGPDIASDRHHRMPMARLRGPAHRGGERVRDSIENLMKTLILIPTRDSKGNKATTRVQLLASTTTTDDEDNPNGEVAYSFHKEVRDIISRSDYWGRIKASVMFAFSSKYALALYEAICLRINLKHNNQFFKPDDFRELLSVDRDLLTRFPDFKRRVLDPALTEVNALSDCNVEVEVIREGGPRSAVAGYRLRWAGKSSEEWQAAMDELLRPKVGRKARIDGKIEITNFMDTGPRLIASRK
ncbi:RepB family plasmid replication initiator protein [Sphingomonas sp. CFBP 8760]|uniref:RepB family plasmid replication initiator protein n=1 Tax=Sphingomonas sp. CFBP 8760 TaxID=2775282 RepID=UPI001A91239F